jgi:hypothetical protein
MRSEPPVRVQVGRAVPVDGGVGVDEGTASGSDDSRGGGAEPDGDPAGGFDWGPSLADAEGKR